jgi:hypothetical protein
MLPSMKIQNGVPQICSTKKSRLGIWKPNFQISPIIGIISGTRWIPTPRNNQQVKKQQHNRKQKKKCCKSCCAYVLIFKYNLFCTAYTNVALMYEFVLTLSIRQVPCERSFSTLKFIKNRLRSMPPDENLPYCIQLIQKK